MPFSLSASFTRLRTVPAFPSFITEIEVRLKSSPIPGVRAGIAVGGGDYGGDGGREVL